MFAIFILHISRDKKTDTNVVFFWIFAAAMSISLIHVVWQNKEMHCCHIVFTCGRRIILMLKSATPRKVWLFSFKRVCHSIINWVRIFLQRCSWMTTLWTHYYLISSSILLFLKLHSGIDSHLIMRKFDKKSCNQGLI